MSEFFTHRTIKATRKPHNCMGCNQPVAVGSPAFYFSMKSDGTFWDGHYHSECRDAECELNEIKDCWGDDWIALFQIAEEPDDVVWLKETYPAIAVAMGFIKVECEQ